MVASYYSSSIIVASVLASSLASWSVGGIDMRQRTDANIKMQLQATGGTTSRSVRKPSFACKHASLDGCWLDDTTNSSGGVPGIPVPYWWHGLLLRSKNIK